MKIPISAFVQLADIKKAKKIGQKKIVGNT